MNAPTPNDLRNAVSLEDLYPRLDAHLRRSGMEQAPVLPSGPARRRISYRSLELRGLQGRLDAAGRLINTELAERRNLILHNPIPDNDYASVRTLVAAYQMIMPGEWARSHRHTPNALRLIVDAEPGTYTVVEGQKVAINPGDVVLTPNWCSHGHGNEGRAAAYWIDFLDVPLVQLLEPMFFEHGEDEEGAAATGRSAPAETRCAAGVSIERDPCAARSRRARPGRHVRDPGATRRAGARYDCALYDAACARTADDAVEDHGEPSLCGGGRARARPRWTVSAFPGSAAT